LIVVDLTLTLGMAAARDHQKFLGLGTEEALAKLRIDVEKLLIEQSSGESIIEDPDVEKGGCHDQADAEWIVIRGLLLRDHDDTPFGRPISPAYRPPAVWPPSERVWCF
jgi:hypothetical protein